MNRTLLLPTQNSTADIVSSQWQVPAVAPRLVAAAEVGHNCEFELLCACCGAPERVSQALRRELQWDRVFEQAAYHRVLPVLYAALQGRAEVPASIHSALRARYLRHCQRAMRFSTELAAILQHFDARGIPVIAQKGPALAHLLYGDSAMRDFGDLDLLVRPTDVSPAVRALTELGYEKKLKLSPRQERAYLRSGYEYVFGRGAERNLIELQWNLLPRFYAIDVNLDELFARSREHEFDGCRAQMLGLEDQFLFLCVHAAKHQWAQVGMVRDIAAIVRFDLDWEFVVREAQRLGIVRIVLVSLLFAESLLGCPLPEGVASLQEIVAAQRFALGIVGRMSAMREIPVESSSYFRFMMQVRERHSDRAKFMWRLAATPGVGEWEAARVSDAFFPLYSAIRVLRLFGRIGS